MSEIRRAFTSRWDKTGYILELDFSQLEIFALAYLSGDTVLKNDLQSGKDLHGISAEMLFGPQYTPEQRKIAKQLSFQLQYGAGAASMAESNGIDKKVAQKFIDNYYSRYQGVMRFHERLLSEVKKGRKICGDRTTVRKIPAGRSTWVSKTGRRYTFVENDAPDWMREARYGREAEETTFSPTQIKNFPVQGFATGDIVPVVVGKLFRRIRQRGLEDRIKMINTIHDSVVFDCKDYAVAVAWAEEAKQIMEDAPRYMKELFPDCADFDVELKVGVEIGTNWYAMEELAI